MFQGPGELAFYLIVVAVKIVGFFIFMLRVQSWYRRQRDYLHAVGGVLTSLFIGEAVLLSLIALWHSLAHHYPDWAWYSARGILFMCFLLACFRFLTWLLVLWLFFRSDFKSRPSAAYALIATCVTFGLDLLGIVIAMTTPAGRRVFFF